jgi:hypothetical protein
MENFAETFKMNVRNLFDERLYLTNKLQEIKWYQFGKRKQITRKINNLICTAVN